MSDTTPEKLGVIILDMAKGYGWLPGSYGYEMVANVRRLKDAARAAGVQVFHVHSMRRPTDNVPNMSMKIGTPALEVIPELEPVDQDIFVYKRYLSGFSHNDLDYTLRTMGIQKVLISGASTDNTVLWTAADAFQNRYGVVIVEDCTIVHRQAQAANQQKAIDIMRDVLHAEILPLNDTIKRYLTAAA